jgi:hypothetical protein
MRATTRTLLSITAIAACLAGLTGVAAASAPPSTGKLACLVQPGVSPTPASDCVVKAGVVTVNNTVPGSGDLVYFGNDTLSGATLGSISALSFTYGGGLAPRLNLPLAGPGFPYVFVEGATCNDGAGHVDVLTDPTCAIQSPNGGPYDNWAAFMTAGGDSLLLASDNQPYIIVDVPSSGTISSVVLGKKATGKK